MKLIKFQNKIMNFLRAFEGNKNLRGLNSLQLCVKEKFKKLDKLMF